MNQLIYDIHCHILPGVDDGARSIESTKCMLSLALEEGIDVIVATPHFANGMSEERRQRIIDIYSEVRELWKELSPNGELYLGNELFYSDGLVEELRRGRALTVDGTKYILVEFPPYFDFRSMRRAVQSLLYAGYIPILAHIERYECLRKYERVQELIDLGAYMQSNVSAIIGKDGLRTKFYVKHLLKRAMIHFVGTDAHDSKDRRPEMEKCRVYLEKKIGAKRTRRILEKNPNRMLKGEKLNG